MWIKDLWDRILANFKKEGDTPVEEPVMELKPENAPEPVPERKTSDEMIIEMAQSVSSDWTEADAAAGEEPADEAERSAAWEIHEDTDPADAAEEAEAPGWEIHEDTDPACEETETDAEEDKKDGN